MKSLKVDIEASVEKDIRNCLRVWPKLLFIGAGLVVSGGLLPALYEPVIAMFKELFSPNFISAAIGSVFFMAGLAAFTFGRGGGVLEPVRSWMMNIAQQIASHIWSACSFAAPIFTYIYWRRWSSVCGRSMEKRHDSGLLLSCTCRVGSGPANLHLLVGDRTSCQRWVIVAEWALAGLVPAERVVVDSEGIGD